MLQIVTKIGENMKSPLVDVNDKLQLRTRALIESVFRI